MTSRCPWSGETFKTVPTRGHQKKFASGAARNEAHTAARMYTEHLIAEGFLSWEQVRAWYEGHKNGAPKPCTAPAVAAPALPAISAPEQVPDAA